MGDQISQIGDKVITIDDQEADTSITFIMPTVLLPGDMYFKDLFN